MNMLRTLKQNLDKRCCAFVLFLAAASLPLFASGTDIMPSGMKNFADNLYATMTGPVIKIVLACFLAGSAIAYAFNKDNEKVKRNCIAIGVGAAILIGASAILDKVWTAASG